MRERIFSYQEITLEGRIVGDACDNVAIGKTADRDSFPGIVEQVPVQMSWIQIWRLYDRKAEMARGV